MNNENSHNTMTHAPVNVGHNVELRRDGDRLTITVDLSQPGRPSSTDDMSVLASIGAYRPVPGAKSTYLSLNLF